MILAGIFTSDIDAKNVKNIHQNVHKEQLANAKSRLDKSVINDILQKEIVSREETQARETKTMSSELSEFISDLLSEAKTHIGKRYRSGGKGPNAFDCSGFSSYVFKQFGFSLGASSRDQYNQGIAVKDKELRPGDLVFFTGRGRRGVGHVGIVVKADNEKGTFQFIHASTSQGIKIDSNTGYYEGRYLGARRVINEEDL